MVGIGWGRPCAPGCRPVELLDGGRGGGALTPLRVKGEEGDQMSCCPPVSDIEGGNVGGAGTRGGVGWWLCCLLVVGGKAGAGDDSVWLPDGLLAVVSDGGGIVAEGDGGTNGAAG